MVAPVSATDTYKNQIRDIVHGDNTLTVGGGGMYDTVADAVAYINTQTRYTTLYDTGTALFINGSRDVIPSGGGADWSGLSVEPGKGELWLLEGGTYTPLNRVAPLNPASSITYDTAMLKYPYEGSTGAKAYSFIRPIWYHIQLLAGDTVDTSVIEWPIFTSISGESKETTSWRGAISVNADEPGFWAKDLRWSGVRELAAAASQEAFVTLLDAGMSDDGYADIVIHDCSCAKGDADADFVYADATTYSNATTDVSRCELYSYYDVIQAMSRNLIVENNSFYVENSISTIIEPTAIRWFSLGNAPTAAELYVSINNNKIYCYNKTGSVAQYALAILPANAAYLSARPDVYGIITGNYIEMLNSGTGTTYGLFTGTSGLWGANNGNVLVDNNVFRVESAGTAYDIATEASNSFLTLGTGNIRVDRSILAIFQQPIRLENHGLSAAISTGDTIPHGIGATPTSISATPTGAKTDVYCTVDSTNITVNFGGGDTSTFHWKAEL